MNQTTWHLLKGQMERLCAMNFYRQKFERAGLKPSDVRGPEDWARVPFTHTDEILSELKRPPSECSLYSKDVTRINFSPSGKDLYPVYHTRSDLQRMNEVCSVSLRAAGVTREDVCAVTFGYHLFIAGLFYQSQLEHYGAKVIPLGPGEAERAVGLIRDYRVSVLISNPSFAVKLAAAGIPDVRILFVGGEPFSSVEGYPERVRAAFGRQIGIIDSYSMALCMPIARSCRHERGLHIMHDFVYAEVVDPATGEPLPGGEKGELVLTHLHKEAAPLLRYRTGDLTYIVEDNCPCGKTITLPKGVVGRTDEMLKVKGVKFWPSQIKGILQSFPELSQNYRVLVRSHRGVDVLELLVEGKAPPEGRLDLLLERLKRETLLGFNAVTFVETLGPGPLAVDERKGKTS